MPPNRDQIICDSGPTDTPIDAGSAAVRTALHSEGVLEPGDASLASGAPGPSALEPTLSFVSDPFSAAVAWSGQHRELDAHLDEAALPTAGKEAPVGGDGPRGPAEEVQVVLGGG